MPPPPPSSPDSTPPRDDPGSRGPTPRRGRQRTGFTLDRFLKYEGLAETGGMAKRLIQEGLVSVNGVVETRRRRQLAGGDVVRVEDEELVVPGTPPEDAASPVSGLRGPDSESGARSEDRGQRPGNGADADGMGTSDDARPS